MASREFLKILSSARLGDVSAQQKLASAYLTGAFKTPIQPANALIWLEKSYFSITNQSLENKSSGDAEILDLLSQIANIPLAETFSSPAFGFGWDSFWKLAEAEKASDANLAAKWQLVNLLINPANQSVQSQLADWLKKNSSSTLEKLSSLDFVGIQKIAKQYLQDLADGESLFANNAKELLIKLQPKNEALSSLWKVWLDDQNEDALIQAAELGLTVAKLTLGLRLAQLDERVEVAETKSNASLKKAAYWLELAAKDGDRDAWYALGEIYRRPQFSGYNAAESDRCIDRAADLGHPQAQLRKGANLWRKREKSEEKVRGLQASYWVWQAHQQGVPEAKELLSKILESCSNPKSNEWYELAQCAEEAINHHAEHKVDEDWLLLCHRIIIANQFNFSKAELLLSEVGQLQHEHCVVVDIRWELPKILPRLIQIETIQQRRALLAAGKAFAGSEMDLEGNLRQRRYRFDRVTNWLTTTFSKNQVDAEVD
ncbi:tetratricopeptide repeat protein [Polynucleobacter sp. AP-RePozz3-80-G7]|uniref:tetratricopeptide repeat protein n=1 Tax=Polynucleobacter sp. AP-RePozz3-80-G7 TaxID=2689105 RepID=UPI001C0ACF06|nr:sel1 repeat family protein [Polynucleobacter sp. AP-RePozz3-80-G7]MBU3638333.1 sel1 repeat family protein [Polynucleobacter sp. AP-RePozz3-80-G7]